MLYVNNNVLGSRSNILWVRPSYPEMYDAVWKEGVTEETGKATGFYPVVVTGTSGIGKSFFGVYAAYRAVIEKNITIVSTMYGAGQPIKRYIITPRWLAKSLSSPVTRGASSSTCARTFRACSARTK